MTDCILAIDATEQWFTDLPNEVDPARTRDHRFYADRFATSGFHLTTRQDVISPEALARLAQQYPHVMVALTAGFDGEKEKILLVHTEVVNELARRFPGVLCLGILGESETHVYHTQPPSATPREAYLEYKRACFRYQGGQRRERVEPLVDRIEQATVRDLVHAVYGTEMDPGLHVLTGPDKVWGVHPHLAWGADGVWLERSGWNSNVQIAISFLRGAARQFGKRWGLDMSPWGGSHTCGRGPTTYDQDGRHVAGVSASLHWFTWWSALLAGADFIKQQAAEVTFYRFPNPTRFGPSNGDTDRSGFPLADNHRCDDPGARGAPLSPVGTYASRLAELVRDPGFDRGHPVVPVALMTELWHGWDGSMFTRERCVWGGAVPIERGDRMMGALFRVLVPGHENAGRMTDPTFNPDVPFASDHEMMAMMYDGMDMRAFERGLFVPTPLGDSFDVVTDDVGLDVLREYALVILAGRLALTPERLPTLRAYVEGGGTLVVHSRGVGLSGSDTPESYRQEVAGLLGVGVVKGYLPGFHPTTLVDTGVVVNEGKYEYVLVELDGARPLAVGENDHPIVTSHTVGRGQVVFSTPYHHLTLTGSDLLGGIKRVLHDLIQPLVPVRIAGEPIQFQVNRTDGGYLVALYNWRPTAWTGTVRLPGTRPGRGRVKELLRRSETPLRARDNHLTFSAGVPPYEVSLYRVTVGPCSD